MGPTGKAFQELYKKHQLPYENTVHSYKYSKTSKIFDNSMISSDTNKTTQLQIISIYPPGFVLTLNFPSMNLIVSKV